MDASIESVGMQNMTASQEPPMEAIDENNAYGIRKQSNAITPNPMQTVTSDMNGMAGVADRASVE